MSDLKPTGMLIDVDGVERQVLFTLSIIDALQEKFGKPFNEIINDSMKDAKDIVKSMTWASEMMELLANDEAEMTKRKELEVESGHFNKYITTENVYEIIAKLWVKSGMDLPEPDEFETPNAESGQNE